MKIYTKTGDSGETGLLGGLRVPKSHPAVALTGTLDETNSMLGLVAAELVELSDQWNQEEQRGAIGQVQDVLAVIQHDLFDLGSRVAACLSDRGQAAEFPASRSHELETRIDQFQALLEPLREFILPGGSRAGATTHLARAISRRAEREMIRLIQSDGDWPCETGQRLSGELIYLNRLSDLLFVLARYINQAAGVPEDKWNVGRRDQSD